MRAARALRAFQIINAENTIMARFSPWKASCRLFFHSFLSSTTCLFTTSIIVHGEANRGEPGAS